MTNVKKWHKLKETKQESKGKKEKRKKQRQRDKSTNPAHRVV
jgi:hypothetical protein